MEARHAQVDEYALGDPVVR
jgi:hypothetical protein